MDLTVYDKAELAAGAELINYLTQIGMNNNTDLSALITRLQKAAWSNGFEQGYSNGVIRATRTGNVQVMDEES